MKNKGSAILGIVWDVVPPNAAYFALRAFHASTQTALLASTGVAALRLVWVAVRSRRFDVFAAFLMAVYGMSFLTALMTGDERFLMLRDSFTTGVLAVGFLVSCAVGWPLIYLAAKRAGGEEAEEAWEKRWTTEPGVRHTFTTLTLVWGAGLLLEAVVRIPLVYMVSPDTMVGVSSALQAVAIIGLLGWSVLYVKRRRQNAAKPGTAPSLSSHAR